MLFAAIALRYAFPYQVDVIKIFPRCVLFVSFPYFKVYAQSCMTDVHGRSVTMQSISSSLKVFFAIFFLAIDNVKY